MQPELVSESGACPLLEENLYALRTAIMVQCRHHERDSQGVLLGGIQVQILGLPSGESGANRWPIYSFADVQASFPNALPQSCVPRPL